MILSIILSLVLYILPIHAYEEKQIHIVILSYNNKNWYKASLDSALGQQYSNFNIIYIDDCSNDGMSEEVQQYLVDHDTAHKVTYIRNTYRKGALANHWMAVHRYCNENAIVVHLDGDGDMFEHKYVLQRINQEYQDKNVWLTYGSYREYPSKNNGWAYEIPPEIIRHNQWRDIRDIRWGPTHLRTFYAWLFKQIKLEDLFFQGTFFPVTGDVAFMYPLAEMAGLHTHFIPDILYQYNTTNPLNDFNTQLTLQLSLLQFLRTQKIKYQPLEQKPLKYLTKTADLVIFSFDRPLQLHALLESVKKYVSGVEKTTIIYRTSSYEFEKAYQHLQQQFPSMYFDKQSHEPPQGDFKPKLLATLFDSSNPYVLFAVDDIVVKDYINLSECIEILEKTHAYGFFLRLGKNITHCYMLWNGPQPLPLLTEVDNNVYAWQFCYGKGDWWYPNTLDMTLYRKKDIKKDFSSYSYTSPNTLEAALFTNPDMTKIGLCYGESKIINIPLNQVQTDRNNRNMQCPLNILLHIYEQGGKIDITPLHKLPTNAVHIEYIPTIIKR